MEKAATDIYTFENLRNGGYSYVDKTAILKLLADDSRGRQFFIANAFLILQADILTFAGLSFLLMALSAWAAR